MKILNIRFLIFMILRGFLSGLEYVYMNVFKIIIEMKI